MATAPLRLGLVVRRSPYEGRHAGAQLDVALAAAALGMPLELFFLGDGLLQLSASVAPAGAALPPGLKAWKSLPALTEVRAWAPEGNPLLCGATAEWLLPLRVEPPAALARRRAACDRVLAP